MSDPLSSSFASLRFDVFRTAPRTPYSCGVSLLGLLAKIKCGRISRDGKWMAWLGPLRNKNTIRFVFPESRRADVNRGLFVEKVVKKRLKMGPDEILCLMAYEKLGIYEVTFHTLGCLTNVWKWLQVSRKTGFLEGLEAQVCGSRYVLIVQMFSPYVAEEDLSLFLKRYCFDVSKGVKIVDGHGLWTGKWRFHVQFKVKDGKCILPPLAFSLGAERGRLFVPEMPGASACWSCRKVGHTSKECTVKRCNQCYGTGHFAKDCPKPKSCSLCVSTDHLFRDCPKRGQSYAGVASRQRMAGEAAASSAKQGQQKEELGESATSHAVSLSPQGVTPHGMEKSGKKTKEAISEGTPAAVQSSEETSGGKQVEEASGQQAPGNSGRIDWAEDYSQEAEMGEVMMSVVAGVKRPLRGEEGDAVPEQRPRWGSGVASSGRFAVLQDLESDAEEESLEELEESGESEGSAESVKEVEQSPPGLLPGWDVKNLIETTGMASSSPPGGEPPPEQT